MLATLGGGEVMTANPQQLRNQVKEDQSHSRKYQCFRNCNYAIFDRQIRKKLHLHHAPKNNLDER